MVDPIMSEVWKAFFAFVAGLIVGFSGGCMTSRSFHAASTSGIPSVVASARRYVGTDQTRKAQCDTLLASDGGTAEAVKAAWAPVRAWYAPAISADALLTDSERSLRTDMINQLDSLISSELARPLR